MRTQCIIAIFPLWSHFNAEDIRSVMSKHTDILGLSLRNKPAQRGTISHTFNFCQQFPLLPYAAASSFFILLYFCVSKRLIFLVLSLETWPIAGRTKVKWMKLDWGWNEGSEAVVPAPSQGPGSTTACRTAVCQREVDTVLHHWCLVPGCSWAGWTHSKKKIDIFYVFFSVFCHFEIHKIALQLQTVNCICPM